jgi:cellulose synthase/poly-beta-1,6-N-acetylglucosamine synthase-like glycosyltransferase
VGVVVIALQGYAAFVVLVMIVFAIRHWYFTMNRLWSPQRPYYQDLFDTNLPHITVVVPMHNEAAVATSVIDALLDSTYPKDRLEILPFDDQSRDDTSAILHEYYERYPEIVKPVYMLGGLRGKPNALNVALRLATHDIILVFDADYTPGKDILRALTTAFSDPEVGAVMGRVIPLNSGKNFLTRLLSLERSGGYQVDQQARYNLDLIPQYGGTVGGFRRSMVTSIGGFDLSTLAEDTDLTARLFIEGRKVVYSNGSECYEEVPESWPARFRQLRRWSRGHNRAFFRNVPGIVQSTHLNFVQKLDGLLLLRLSRPAAAAARLCSQRAALLHGRATAMVCGWGGIFCCRLQLVWKFCAGLRDRCRRIDRRRWTASASTPLSLLSLLIQLMGGNARTHRYAWRSHETAFAALGQNGPLP